MTVVLAVLLPVVLAYQGWTYHVFRSRLTPTEPPGDGARPAAPPPAVAAGTQSQAPRRAEAGGRPSTWPSRPLTRLAWLLIAWLIARLIARLMAAVLPAAPGAGR
jgi:hypothetical protein